MSTRSIRRNKVRNRTHSRKENNEYNRRAFAVMWQRLQVKKFGGIKSYLEMRGKKKKEQHMDITVYA